MSSIIKLNFAGYEKPKLYTEEKEAKMRVKEVRMDKTKKGAPMPTLICVDTINPEYSACFLRLVFPTEDQSPEATQFMIVKLITTLENLTGEKFENKDLEYDFARLKDKEFFAKVGIAKMENGEIMGNEIKAVLKPA